MSSFGEGIQITPFQLVSLAAAFANGGTLYYLQYPRTPMRSSIAPRIKRDLNIAPVLPEIREGMLAAVLYGTASAASTLAAKKCRSAKPAPAMTRLPA
jgi:cell division protein FtsI/penicillin-binding protein 2